MTENFDRLERLSWPALLRPLTGGVFAAWWKVRVVYDPEDVDLFIAVADAIEEAFPALIVEGEEAEAEAGGGGGASSGGRRFVMSTDDGRILFERKEADQEVDPEAMVQLLVNDAGLKP